MAFAALPAARQAPGGGDAVARALAAAGGYPTLSRVRAVAWSGTARMMLGATPVDLNVETRIEPFVRGRSDTWLTSEGRSAARTMMVEREDAFLVHEGAQTRLPDAQARFEREQLGAYAYLLLAPASVSAAGPGRLNAAHGGYPPISLTLAADGRIAGANYALTAPDRAGMVVRQHFDFAGTVTARGVRFPRLVTILQNGRPFLRMTITEFSVEVLT